MVIFTYYAVATSLFLKLSKSNSILKIKACSTKIISSSHSYFQKLISREENFKKCLASYTVATSDTIGDVFSAVIMINTNTVNN